MRRLILDFETQSACDLKSAGAYKYSLDPSTRATCLAVKFVGQPNEMFLDYDEVNRPWSCVPQGFRYQWQQAISDGYEITGHNAFFETVIYKNVMVKRWGWPDIPFRQFRCTAAKAAACALPRSLEGAGTALALTTQKDKRGFVAMMLSCKPTKQWNAWQKARNEIASGRRVGPKKIKLAEAPEPQKFMTPKTHPDVFQTLYEYCRIDARTEELLDQRLPDLIPDEQEIWFLNQQLNWNGVRVDIPTIKKIVGIMEIESATKLKELDKLTMGLVTKPGARASILEFLALEGVELPDIRAKTVEDVLAAGKLSPDMKRLLEIRQALSKASTKKYKAFLARANDDGRVRDILLYHGAVPTGRDTGTGIQVHNFPRGVIKIDKARPYAAVENVVECDHEMLKVLYGESLPLVFSSILRNMILPSNGRRLAVADFSKVEVAVLWWLADNRPGLKILKAGMDPYKYQAAFNTGKRYEDISDEGNERQLGKAQVLGCGFGMGSAKFQTTAWDMYRLKLTNEQSLNAVNSYRKANSAVPDLWKLYERAAIDAIEFKGKFHVKAGKCTFFMREGFLWIQLPSGRRMAYPQPRVTWRDTDFGPQKGIEFMGLAPSKKELHRERTWGGTLVQGATQGVARDLMMHALVRLNKKGYKPILAVHDEALCDLKPGGSVEEFVNIQCERPSWVDEHLPIEAKGFIADRYRK